MLRITITHLEKITMITKRLLNGIPKRYNRAFRMRKPNWAYLYIQGKDVTQDIDKGKDLLLKAITHNSGLGCYYLGQYYQKPVYGIENIAKAIEYYHKEYPLVSQKLWHNWGISIIQEMVSKKI